MLARLKNSQTWCYQFVSLGSTLMRRHSSPHHPFHHYSSVPILTTPPLHRTYVNLGFDTYKLVRQLEHGGTGFTRGQSVGIMKTINALLIHGRMAMQQEILSKGELENETYLYKAHLSELRSELQLLQQNNTSLLKARVETLTRDIENIQQKFNESLSDVKSDIGIDIGAYKHEGRELETETNLRIQNIHHKLIIRISELKTNIETSKVDMTRTVIWLSLATVSAIVAFDFILPESAHSLSPSSSSSSASMSNLP